MAVSDRGGPSRGASELCACPERDRLVRGPSGGASSGQEQVCHGAGVPRGDRNEAEPCRTGAGPAEFSRSPLSGPRFPQRKEWGWF